MNNGVNDDQVQALLDRFGFDSSHCFIGGEWQAPVQGDTLGLDNPSTGANLCRIAKGTSDDIDKAVGAAQTALKTGWGRATAVERGRLLQRLSALVLENVDVLAHLEALDVGKPLSQARADAVALARYCEFYAGAADKIHGDTLPYLEGYTAFTLREPHGVTAHIVPWNYPMQIIGRSVGAALAMGNACVLKPAEEACLTALVFAELVSQAGFPTGALNVVPGIGSEAGAALTVHPGVNHISFTGSVATGSAVQAAASQAVVPVTLELGGKSAQVVFDDVDVDASIPFLVNAGIQNAGQTCSASSRLLVQRGIYPQIVERLVQRYENLVVGDALMDLNVGPLISGRQHEIVNSYLEQGKDLQKVATGVMHEEASASGHFVLPTLYADVPAGHLLAQEEIFGPVQVVIPFDDEDEAIAIANGTDYGLVASVWSCNGATQMRMVKALRAGQVFVNNYGAGGGVELPFGGVGKSGHGREKGFEALYGFSTLKTVAMSHG